MAGYNAFYRGTDYDKLDVDVLNYAVDSYGGGLMWGIRSVKLHV